MTTISAEVFDGERVVGVRAVTWSDGIITAVEPTDAEPCGYLLPGLIDTHVHLGGSAAADLSRVDATNWPLVTPREEQSLHVAANCRRSLQAGVTTLRELSGDGVHLAVARVFDAGIDLGPRLTVGGQVGMSAGHGDLFWPRFSEERPPTADSPWECRALVRRWARLGCDTIKVYTSGGVLSIGDTVGWRNHTREELEATVDEAHALSLRVAAHAHSEEGIQIALDLGVDSIEHATSLSEAQADAIAGRGLPVAPTLLINDMIAGGALHASAEAREKAAELVERRDAHFRSAADRGVDFVLGTDASGYFLPHGQQWRELCAMQRVFGWDAGRTLQAATARAALALGSAAGRVAVGAPADLILSPARPWEDLAALRPETLAAVVVRGQVAAGRLP